MLRTKIDIYSRNISFLTRMLLIAFLLQACSATRYVPEDEYMVKSVQLHLDNKDLNKEEMRMYIRQKPNKTILGLKFHLWMYNRSNIRKSTKWHEWLRRNGEEPVVWNSGLTSNSVQQLTMYLEKSGYYHAHVTDTFSVRSKKVKLIYNVRSGEPSLIRIFKYDIKDGEVRRIVYEDTAQSLIRSGMILNEPLLQRENERITGILRNCGYYSFSAQNIHYQADTTFSGYRVDLTLQINNLKADSSGITVQTPFSVYRLDKISVDAQAEARNTDNIATEPAVADSFTMGDVSFVMARNFPVDAATIAPLVMLRPDSLFRQDKMEQTKRMLTNLNTFQLVNIDFVEKTSLRNEALLDANINLIPFRMQSYAVELEGTNSSGNLGGALNLVYQHKSLFGHAEVFDFRVSGMIEALHKTGFNFNNTLEYGVESGITVPKFVSPFKFSRFVASRRPTTTFSVQYNYQRRPDYQRTIMKASLSYNWRTGLYSSHSVRPVDINFVRLPYATESFKHQIAGTYLENSYTNHMVPSGAYTYQYNNQGADASADFIYLRFNAETAGFLMNSLFEVASASKQKPYKIFGNEFSQFVKADLDFRFFKKLGINTLVYRVFAGMGVPYGNSKSIPFERKFFAGGANSNRGWQVRTLGPGSFQDTIPHLFPNSTGDIKLEANMEYRFKLVWIIESALFVDAGNVWDIHKEEKRPGANFAWNRFYREFALSSGFGFRFVSKYFIIRTDLGMRIRDPMLHRWVTGSDALRLRNTQIHLGIGYPF